MVEDEKTKEIILNIVDKIKKDYQPEKIILYGSYAYGNPDRDSDIDLFIIKETDERPIDRRVAIRRIVDIRDAAHPPFSPIVITPQELKTRLKIGDQFVEEILTRGEVLYGH